MAQFIGSVLSVLIGVATWLLLFIVAREGVPQMGRTGSAELWTMFAPILIFGLPVIGVAFAQAGAAAGFLTLALAPLLAPLNFLLVVEIVSRLGVEFSQGLLMAGALWVALSAMVLWSAIASGKRALAGASGDGHAP